MDTTGFQLLIETLKLALMLAAPLLAAALVAGLASGAFQATTTVNDPSLSTVPRLALGALAAVFAGPWIMGRLMAFALALLSDLERFVR